MRYETLDYIVAVAVAFFLISCGGKNRDADNHGQMFDKLVSDTLRVDPEDSDTAVVPVPADSVLEYMENSESAAEYRSGILPVIAREVPEYAEKLINSRHDAFLVVDKASMRIIYYDRFGMPQHVYDMACAKNYGTKHEKGDSRTPEGFFSVQGVYDSTEWLFTDDNGVTSKKKGQFGPRFIRLKIPGTTQIGIHGTCAPWSIGHRVSHGCIRITNDKILELVELVEPGMPVIVLPGKRDRAANRKEGVSVPYFPTAPKYAISESEKILSESSEDPSPVKETVGDKNKSDSLATDTLLLDSATGDEKSVSVEEPDTTVRVDSI